MVTFEIDFELFTLSGFLVERI